MSHKVALVTGASSGIGESAARRLHEAGFVVYGAARRTDRMTALAAAGVRTVALDVTDESSVEKVVAGILADQGRIDVLINNAAVDPRTLDHPLVLGELGLRFYAAAPIRTHDGYRLGTVNVIDNRPRETTARQLQALEHLASMVSDELELRLMVIRSAAAEQRMRQATAEVPPYARQMTEILRLAVALVQARKDAENLRRALSA